MVINRRLLVRLLILFAGSYLLLFVPLAGVKFIAGATILLILPFYPLSYRIAQKLELPGLDTLALSLGLGLVFAPFYLFLLKGVQYNKLLLYSAPVIICILLSLALRVIFKPSQAVPNAPAVPYLAWLGIALLMLVILTNMLNVGINNSTGNFAVPYKMLFKNPYDFFTWTFNFDFFKHMAFSNELMKTDTWMPRNPYLCSERLHYYWFYHMITASLQILTGINMVQNQVGFAILLTFLFAVTAVLLMRRYAPLSGALIVLTLFLGISQSYEYLRPLIAPREVGIDNPFSRDFINWLLQPVNVDWIASRYHHFFRNYLFIQHLIAGAIVGMWATYLFISERLKRFWTVIPIFMVASIIMYNSFVFIAFFLAIAVTLLTSLNPKGKNAGAGVVLASFIPSFFDLKFFCIPFFVLLGIWIKTRTAQRWKFVLALIIAVGTAYMLMKGFVDPTADNRLFNFTPGLNIQDIRDEIGHCSMGMIPPIKNKLWDVMIFTSFMTFLLFLPALLVQFVRFKPAQLAGLTLGFIGLILLVHLYGVSMLFPAISQLLSYETFSGNILSVIVYLLEIGPALPFAIVALMLAEEENPLLHFSLVGFLITMIALNLFYIFNPDDYILKISVINKLFISLLGAYGFGRLYQEIKKSHWLKRLPVIVSAFIILLVAVPQVLQDTRQHIDARTSTYAQDDSRRATATWFKTYTAPDAILLGLPLPKVMDAFHHIAAVFFDRRSVYADPWHALFGTSSDIVNRVLQLLTIAVYNDNPSLSLWILRFMKIDYLFTYEESAEINTMFSRITEAEPDCLTEHFRNGNFKIFELKKPKTKSHFEIIQVPQTNRNEEVRRMELLGIPFDHIIRTPATFRKSELEQLVVEDFPLEVKLYFEAINTNPIRVTVQVQNSQWQPTTEGTFDTELSQFKETKPAELSFVLNRDGTVISHMQSSRFDGMMSPMANAGYISFIPHHSDAQGLGGVNFAYTIDGTGKITMKPRGFLYNFAYPPSLTGKKPGSFKGYVISKDDTQLPLTGDFHIPVNRNNVRYLFVMGNATQPWDQMVTNIPLLGYYDVVYEDGMVNSFPINPGQNFFDPGSNLDNLILRVKEGQPVFVLNSSFQVDIGPMREFVRIIPVDPKKVISRFSIRAQQSDYPIPVTGLTAEIIDENP